MHTMVYTAGRDNVTYMLIIINNQEDAIYSTRCTNDFFGQPKGRLQYRPFRVVYIIGTHRGQ